MLWRRLSSTLLKDAPPAGLGSKKDVGRRHGIALAEGPVIEPHQVRPSVALAGSDLSLFLVNFVRLRLHVAPLSPRGNKLPGPVGVYVERKLRQCR